MRNARRRANPDRLRDEALDVESDARRLDLVSGLQQSGAFRRRLQRLRNDERNRLVGVAHPVVLQRLHTKGEEASLRFRIASQRRPVGGSDHLHYMRMRFGGLDVEMHDAAARDRADGAHRIQHSFGMAVRGVGCATSDLEDGVAAGERLAHVRAVARIRRGLVAMGLRHIEGPWERRRMEKPEGHVWTAPLRQGFGRGFANASGAVMSSACWRGKRMSRWP